eukprot:symbB.v1.2.036160.t1/scaffold5040.1/size31563/1
MRRLMPPSWEALAPSRRVWQPLYPQQRGYTSDSTGDHRSLTWRRKASQLQRSLDLEPENPRRFAELLRALNHFDPQQVIRLFELRDPRVAFSNSEAVREYVRALVLANRLDYVDLDALLGRQWREQKTTHTSAVQRPGRHGISHLTRRRRQRASNLHRSRIDDSMRQRSKSRSRSPLRECTLSEEEQEALQLEFARYYWLPPEGNDPPWLGTRALRLTRYRLKLLGEIEQLVDARDLDQTGDSLRLLCDPSIFARIRVRWQRFILLDDLARMSDVLFRGPIDSRHADEMDLRLHRAWRILRYQLDRP